MFKPAADHDHPAPDGGGVRWLALAAGCAAAVLFVALTAPPLPAAQRSAPARMLLDTAPTDAWTSTVRLAALDEGVDWSRVETVANVAPAAIAAYEP